MPRAAKEKLLSRLNTAASDGLVRRVDRAAQKRNLNRSEWVRDAVIQQLKREKEK